MDIPGRDPVILLWVWWVSLALSCFLNFASFPMQIPVQSSVLICQRHRYEFVCFFPVMAGDCGDEIPSKSKPQSAGVMSYANPANLLSFRCFIFNFPKFPYRALQISKRFFIFARVILHHSMLHCATTCPHKARRSLWHLLFLSKR